MKLFKTSFWIAIILSLGYMVWRALSNKGIVCGYLNVRNCSFLKWLTQFGIMFIVLFIVLIVLLGILNKKRKNKGFGVAEVPKDNIKEKAWKKKIKI